MYQGILTIFRRVPGSLDGNVINMKQTKTCNSKKKEYVGKDNLGKTRGPLVLYRSLEC